MTTRDSLNGTWLMSMPGAASEEHVQIPGCWEVAEGPKDVEGPVILRRSFKWASRSRDAVIRFDRVSYFCEVRINGWLAATHEGMWDGFVVPVSRHLQLGSDNWIELTVWKPGYRPQDRFPLRQVLSGFLPDVGITFGGIWGDVWLESFDAVAIDSASADSDIQGAVSVTVRLRNASKEERKVRVEVVFPGGSTNRNALEGVDHRLAPESEARVKVPLKLENPRPWSPEDPYLYRCIVTATGDGFDDSYECRLGLRSIESVGTAILLNGRPIYLRGVLHWGYYDRILSPSPDRPTIEKEISVIKSYGFNLIKHCLYIPNDDYFDAADEAGMLLWIELPLWQPEACEGLDRRIRTEYPRILEILSGHPSIVVVSLGCELDQTVPYKTLEDMYRIAHESVHALVRDNSGSGECFGGFAEDQADFSDYHFYTDLHQFEPLLEMFTPAWRMTRSWLFGEYCDSDTLRSLEKVRMTTNRDSLWWASANRSMNPLSGLKRDFRLSEQDTRSLRYGIAVNFKELEQISVKHAMTHRKTMIEMTRSFQEVGGYCITALRDVPLATSGILDDALDVKFDAAEFSRFNADLVLLPSWDPGRKWRHGDVPAPRERYNHWSGSRYGVRLLVSNYSGSDFEADSWHWTLSCTGSALLEESGWFDSRPCIPSGRVGEIHRLELCVPETSSPRSCILCVDVHSGSQTLRNEWPIFLYPRVRIPKTPLYDPRQLLEGAGWAASLCKEEWIDARGHGGIAISTEIDGETIDWVRSGGRLLCIQSGKGALPTHQGPFWRESFPWRHDHPVLKDFDRIAMEDLRLFGVSTDTFLDRSAIMEWGAAELTPILSRVDCRENTVGDYLSEIRLDKGLLLATTLRLEGGIGRQPLGITANPFSEFLVDRCLAYLGRDP